MIIKRLFQTQFNLYVEIIRNRLKPYMSKMLKDYLDSADETKTVVLNYEDLHAVSRVSVYNHLSFLS